MVSSRSSASWRSRSRCFSSSFRGVSTMMVTPRSPLPPPRSLGTPRPLSGIRVPDCVPAGTSTVTFRSASSEPSHSASRVVNSTLVPRAAAVIGRVITASRLSPSRRNRSCSATISSTYRSPAGPPPRPTSPRPSKWIRFPVDTPAGMRTEMSRELLTRPSPEHSPQGLGMIVPKP